MRKHAAANDYDPRRSAANDAAVLKLATDGVAAETIAIGEQQRLAQRAGLACSRRPAPSA